MEHQENEEYQYQEYTVQQLIDKLQQCEDKTLPVMIEYDGTPRPLVYVHLDDYFFDLNGGKAPCVGLGND